MALGWGIVGTGGIARQFTQDLLLTGHTVTAAGSRTRAGADQFAGHFGLPAAHASYEALVADPAVDLVYVATPHPWHYPNAALALEAGKHVMVEKPMAMNAAEAQRMLDAARRAGRQLIVGFQHRFEPKSRFIHQQVADGNFGKVLYVRAQALRRRGIPSWGVFGRKEIQGGGPLIDIGVHILETAHYLIGSPRPISATGKVFTYLGNLPASAMAPWGPWDHSTYTVEDLAVGMIRFENGTMMTVESSFAAHIEKDVFNITILGERGGADWESRTIYTDQGGYMVNSTAQYLGSWDHFQYKMNHFVEVCRDGKPSEVPPEHGLMVQQMLDAIYASAATGREVEIT